MSLTKIRLLFIKYYRIFKKYICDESLSNFDMFVNRLKYFFAFMVIKLIVIAPLLAQDQEIKAYQLDEISVTATRIKRKTSEIPASVTIVGKKTINSSKMFNIKDALTGIPGVLIDTKSQGYDSRLIIRGAGLKARYGVRDIMVLMDGIPITDPDSFTRLDFIDTQLIDQVEVVKGPNSTLWGANAAGGVINITTKDPMERQGGIVKIGAGNYKTMSTHLSFSGNKAEKLYYTVSSSHRQSDNSWRRWNKFYTTQGTFQSSCLFDNGSALQTYFGYTKASLKLPGKLNETMFTKYMDSGKASETEGPWQFMGRYSEIYFFNSRFSKKIGSFEFKPLVYINNWSHNHPVTGKISKADTNTYGTDIQISNMHMIGKTKGILIAGITARRDDQDTDYFKYKDIVIGNNGRIISTLSDSRGDFMEIQKKKVDLYGVYIQESFRFGKRWLLDTGIRYDSIKFDISKTQWSYFDWGTGKYIDNNNNGITSSVDYKTKKSFENVCPRIGAVYKISRFLNIYANISKGIKTPTEGEIDENPNLNIVKVINYEAGLKARDKKWTMDTAVYFSPVKDEVVQIVQKNNNSEYINAGETEKKGFELAASLNITSCWTVSYAYSYTNYTFKKFTEKVRTFHMVENEDRSGNFLPFIPKHQYSFFVNYQHPGGFKLNIHANYWGEYYLDNANSEKYKGRSMVTNGMLGYNIGKFEISLLVSNIFDKHYATEATKDTSGVKRYVPAAQRTYMVKCVRKF